MPVENQDQDVVAFVQELVRCPSLPGEEGNVGDIILKRMSQLKYDEVRRDEIGNVIGIVRGNQSAPRLLYNGHIDHVTPGFTENWRFAPYSATISEGKLYGRGVADMKGAVGAMVAAGGALAKIDKAKRDFGDVIVGCVVLEEPSMECFGTKYLLEHDGILCDYAVSGESTNFEVAISGRGRVEFVVNFYGKAAHSSAPWRGINAMYKAARFLEALETYSKTKLPTHEFLGSASLAPTAISCYPGDPDHDTVPDKCTINFERRLVPPEDDRKALADVEGILMELSAADPEFKADVKLRASYVKDYHGKSWTGVKMMGNPWLTERDSPIVRSASAVVKRVLGTKPKISKYTFGTDLNYVAGVKGITSIGLGPGMESLAHIVDEYLSVADIQEALRIYTELPSELARVSS